MTSYRRTQVNLLVSPIFCLVSVETELEDNVEVFQLSTHILQMRKLRSRETYILLHSEPWRKDSPRRIWLVSEGWLCFQDFTSVVSRVADFLPPPECPRGPAGQATLQSSAPPQEGGLCLWPAGPLAHAAASWQSRCPPPCSPAGPTRFSLPLSSTHLLAVACLWVPWPVVSLPIRGASSWQRAGRSCWAVVEPALLPAQWPSGRDPAAPACHACQDRMLWISALMRAVSQRVPSDICDSGFLLFRANEAGQIQVTLEPQCQCQMVSKRQSRWEPGGCQIWVIQIVSGGDEEFRFLGLAHRGCGFHGPWESPGSWICNKHRWRWFPW